MALELLNLGLDGRAADRRGAAPGAAAGGESSARAWTVALASALGALDACHARAVAASGRGARLRLIGSSFGAHAAARYAALHPSRVDRLVLLAPALDLSLPPVASVARRRGRGRRAPRGDDARLVAARVQRRHSRAVGGGWRAARAGRRRWWRQRRPRRRRPEGFVPRAVGVHARHRGGGAAPPVAVVPDAYHARPA